MAIPVAFYVNMVWVVTLYSGGDIFPGLVLFVSINTISYAISGILPYTLSQYCMLLPLMAVLYTLAAKLAVYEIFGRLPWMFNSKNMQIQPPRPNEMPIEEYNRKYEGRFLGTRFFLAATAAMILSILVYLPIVFVYGFLQYDDPKFPTFPTSYSNTTIVRALVSTPIILTLITACVNYFLLSMSTCKQKAWPVNFKLVVFLMTVGIPQAVPIFFPLLVPGIIIPEWNLNDSYYVNNVMSFTIISIYVIVMGLALRPSIPVDKFRVLEADTESAPRSDTSSTK